MATVTVAGLKLKLSILTSIPPGVLSQEPAASPRAPTMKVKPTTTTTAIPTIHEARFTSICVQALDAVGRPLDVAHPGCDLSIDVNLQCESNFAHANLAIIFYDSNGYRLIDTNTAQKGDFVRLQAGQIARANFLLRDVLLKPGRYLIGLWLGREGVETVDHVEHATTLDLAEGDETRGHPVLYPGTYLCRFEENVSIINPR